MDGSSSLAYLGQATRNKATVRTFMDGALQEVPKEGSNNSWVDANFSHLILYPMNSTYSLQKLFCLDHGESVDTHE